jgi:hypothetical protein
MKIYKVILTFLLIIILQTCDTVESNNGYIQIVPGDDSLIPDSIKTLMREDAAGLTLRDVHSNPTNKEDLIILPENVLESYYRGFVHFYNASFLTARDLVIEIYKIRAFRYPETHSVMISVDSTRDWVNAWRNGQQITGNQEIDFLMETYNLELDRYYAWPFMHLVVINSEEAINIFALCRKFQQIEGVFYAEPNGVIGDGNDIKGSIKDNYIVYEYSFGWGDCPSGCIYRHYWLFQVQFDGTVNFIKSYGDPLP